MLVRRRVAAPFAFETTTLSPSISTIPTFRWVIVTEGAFDGGSGGQEAGLRSCRSSCGPIRETHEIEQIEVYALAIPHKGGGHFMCRCTFVYAFTIYIITSFSCI